MSVICVCDMPCGKEKGVSVMHVQNVCLNVNDVAIDIPQHVRFGIATIDSRVT